MFLESLRLFLSFFFFSQEEGLFLCHGFLYPPVYYLLLMQESESQVGRWPIKAEKISIGVALAATLYTKASGRAEGKGGLGKRWKMSGRSRVAWNIPIPSSRRERV